MTQLPGYQAQIEHTHAALIVAVVEAAQQRRASPELQSALATSEQNGWIQLVAAIRRIVSGARQPDLLAGLDEEDATIIAAILRGIQNPASLPNPGAVGDPAMAAPGLAQIIHTARAGEPHALAMAANLAEQMTRAGGDMARIGGAMRRLVEGERDPDVLDRGLSASGRSLLNSVLEALAQFETH
ncbi:MAG: hypothetical protein ACFCUG_00360 [Thiotrichales bacterium]